MKILSMTTSKYLNIKNLLLLFAFLFGANVVTLKIVSILKILDKIGIQKYPLLMLSQGLIFVFTLSFFFKVQKKTEKVYFSTLFTSTLILIYTGLFYSDISYLNVLLQSSWEYEIIFHIIVFWLANLFATLLENALHDMVAKNISLLKNPNMNYQVSLIYEIGILTGASLTIYLKNYYPILYFYQVLFPVTFIFSCMPLYFMLKKDDSALLNKNPTSKNEAAKNIFKKPFLKWLTCLIFILYFSKHLQGFIMLLGVDELKKQNNSNISTLFSQLIIIQTVLIILILIFNAFKKRQAREWYNRIRFYLSYHFLSLLVIALIPSGITYLGTTIVRKLFQRTFVNQSISLMLGQFPSFMQSQLRSTIIKRSQVLSFLTLSLLTYLYFKLPPDYRMYLWLGLGLISLIGVFVSFKSLRALNDFHIENITGFHKNNLTIVDAENSCLALANKNAIHHFDSLTILLWWKPKPLLTKSIIYALGKMKHSKNVETLMKTYIKFDRYDIKFESLYALRQYQKNILYKKFILSLKKDFWLNIITDEKFKPLLCFEAFEHLYVLNSHLDQFELDSTEIHRKNDSSASYINYLKLLSYIERKYAYLSKRSYLENPFLKYPKSQHLQLLKFEIASHHFQSKTPHSKKMRELIIDDLKRILVNFHRSTEYSYIPEKIFKNSKENSLVINNISFLGKMVGEHQHKLKDHFGDLKNIFYHYSAPPHEILLALFKTGDITLIMDHIINLLFPEDRPRDEIFKNILFECLGDVNTNPNFKKLFYTEILDHYPQHLVEVYRIFDEVNLDFDQDRILIFKEAMKRNMENNFFSMVICDVQKK